VGGPPRLPRDTTLSTEVCTKFRQQVAVAQSVEFACGLKATEFFFKETLVACTHAISRQLVSGYSNIKGIRTADLRVPSGSRDLPKTRQDGCPLTETFSGWPCRKDGCLKYVLYGLLTTGGGERGMW
jgi:hypothetical protein